MIPVAHPDVEVFLVDDLVALDTAEPVRFGPSFDSDGFFPVRRFPSDDPADDPPDVSAAECLPDLVLTMCRVDNTRDKGRKFQGKRFHHLGLPIRLPLQFDCLAQIV